MPDSADFAYVRFHGLGHRLYDYSDDELRPWADTVSGVLASGRDAYVFFNNDYSGNAVRNALTFQAVVRRG